MSAPQGSKSSGMRFAEQHMQSQGWKQGQGLGKKENGISEAIKVKIKCGKAGVGHDSAEQFTFHWWDHIFNKTASNIDIQTGQNGGQMSKLTAKDVEITNKKPQKGLGNRSMLYGRFIKAATLMSGGEEPAEKPASSDSSDSSEDEEKLDLSSAKQMTDEELIRVCGGRTAHKGARHGLTMSAKLARLEEQEKEFLAKYRKKDRKCVQSEKQQPANESEDLLLPENARRNKKKPKKSKERDARSGDRSEADRIAQEADSPTPKNRSKRAATDLNSDALDSLGTKKITIQAKELVEADCSETELQAEAQQGTKRRKKRKKHSRDLAEAQIQTESCGKTKKKKRKLQED